MAERKALGIDVLTAARERVAYTLSQFKRVYISFSGGKDSTVMLHLAIDEAKKRNIKIGVLFIDWEVQYKLTIDHCLKIFEEYKDYIIPYWVALPLTTECPISQYAPFWTCWDKDKKDLWIRQPPEYAITDYSYFDFYTYGMTFEEFIIKFGEWYATQGFKKDESAQIFEPTACMVGIRADESLNRLLKVRVHENREYWNDKIYLLNLKSSLMDVVLCHPLYDWKTEDIWKYNGKYYKSYNKIYDLMYQAKVPISKQRIDEFFGPEARRGLWMLHEIEPETWSKVTGRIVGCNSAALYSKEHGNINGDRKIIKPNGHTWKSFAELLLASMPDKLSEHYKNKIATYLHWYKERGYERGLPDEIEGDLETKDKHPSWRRICKVLLRNDYWCKALSFTPTKATSYENYLKVMRNRRARWGMLI